MPSVVQTLTEKGLIKPPRWLPGNTMYEVIMGSLAYATSNDDSDMDIYGFCIPEVDMIFPHLSGEILDFGTQKERFHQYQSHHIKSDNKEYDLTIFGIVRFFHLAMKGNPSIVDSCFVPDNCILHITQVGNIMRDNRKLFLTKACWPRLKGYAYSQLHAATNKNPEKGSKRADIREKFGMDVKFLMHTVRLLLEAEMILSEGDLDLQRHKEHLKAIKKGEIPEEDIRKWVAEKEMALEKVYAESKLPWGPDEEKVKTVLINCLETHYGSLDKLGYKQPDAAITALKQIQSILDANRNLL